MTHLLALLALGIAACASAQPQLPSDVQAVIDRSHNSRGNYAVFLTTEVTTSSDHWTELGAEFQQGSMHRIEVPMTRILHNCETGANTAYDIPHGRYLDEEAAVKGVCGIDLNADRVVSGRMLEPVFGSYGRADRIELIGEKFVRRYSVTTDGIVVANDYIPRNAKMGFALRTVGTILKRGAQDPAMFTHDSLARGFAPALPAQRP